MTHLRQIMLEELRRRNYAESTIYIYIHTVEHFSRRFHCSPDQSGPEHIRQYQAALFTRWKLAPNTVTQLRNLGLKLRNRRALLQPTSTARTLRRQRYFHYFVDSLRDWPTTATPVLRAAFASRFLRMGFGFLSREGSRLALTRSQSFFQHPSQPLDLAF